jgi:hypothetical protein
LPERASATAGNNRTRSVPNARLRDSRVHMRATRGLRWKHGRFQG